MSLQRLLIPALILFPVATVQVPAQEPPPSSQLLQNGSGQNNAFAGVGQFRGPLQCTGSLIDPASSGAPGAKAWLLTAGHCVSLEPYGVIRNQPLTATVQFHFFVDTPERRVTIRTRAAGWSTMKGTDLALIELDTTLGGLGALGIRPLRLSPAALEAGRRAFWTGFPGSPIPPEQQFLRRGGCTLGGRVQLLEGSWIWNDEISNNCPDLYEGASGSPLFDAESGEVIGVIGTSTLLNFNQGPDYDCQRNRPCVIRAGGPAMQRDTSYASPVQAIGQCFDQTNELDVGRPGCPLDPGLQLNVQSVPSEVRPIADGKPAAWDAALTGTQRYFAYKHLSMGEGDCAGFAGYSAPMPVAANPVITDPVGRDDGYYLLCVIAGDTPSFDSTWQQPAHASARFKRLDSQPPVVAVDYEIEELTNTYRLVNLTGGGGPSGLGVALIKRGSPSATDCSDSQDYRIQLSIPEVIRAGAPPTRICWKMSDKAGNFADPVAFDFGAPALLPEGMRNAASLARGTVAAGSAFRIDTFNLTASTEFSPTPVATLAGARVSMRDSSGRTLPMLLTTAGPLYLQGVIPDTAAAGQATAIVQPPEGPSLSQSFRISRTAPGIYFDPGTGAPSGYAGDSQGNVFPIATCADRGCYLTHLPLASTEGGLALVLYGTGLRAAREEIRLRVGTQILDAVSVSPHPDFAGVDELRVQLPRDFPLHLYQPISAETPDGASNYLWIYLE